MKKFDAIVVGVGTMGSSACYWLASKGYSVLGLEQFNSPHDKGSHSGQSRIIRKAYFEHPDYVPLLERAYENWRMLEESSGETVYYPTGIVYFGLPSHQLIEGTKNAANLHQLNLESFSADQTKNRFPQFNVEGYDTLFEPDAGLLLPSKCISTYIRLALTKGAIINSDEKFIAWKKQGSVIIIKTDKSEYSCDKLILTAGAWINKLLPKEKFIQPTRQILIWVNPKDAESYSPSNFPCWMLAAENAEGIYYGFPYLDDSKFGKPSGLKFAYHFPGEITDPDKLNTQVSRNEVENIIDRLSEFLPAAKAPIVATSTCIYENSADGDFIIDYLPDQDNKIIIAAGFSGHGFKFASVVGEILCQMAEGKTELPIEFLGLRRFSA